MSNRLTNVQSLIVGIEKDDYCHGDEKETEEEGCETDRPSQFDPTKAVEPLHYCCPPPSPL